MKLIKSKLIVFKDKLFQGNYHKNDEDEIDSEEEDDQKKKVKPRENFLNIWKENPFAVDIDRTNSVKKLITLLAINFFYSMVVFFLTNNIIFAGMCYAAFLVCFALVFYDNCFVLEDFFRMNVSKSSKIDPFKKIVFFFSKEKPEMLYYTSRKNLSTTGIIIYELKRVPEMIHPNWHSFVNSLAKTRISYTYQVVQIPLILKDDPKDSLVSKQNKINTIKSFKTSIYFSIYFRSKGIVSKSKISRVENALEDMAIQFETISNASLYHIDVVRLSGKDLISAIRSTIMKVPYSESLETDCKTILESSRIDFVKKIGYISFITVFSTIGLLILSVSIWIVVIIEIVVAIVIFRLWWPEIFSPITIKELQKPNYITINPFLDAKFFFFRACSSTLFIHQKNNLLIGFKSFNLKKAISRFYSKKGEINSLCKPDNFFRALDGKQVPFMYTILNAPLSFYRFYKESRKFLTSKAKRDVESINVNEISGKDWLESHSGFFKSILNSSVVSCVFTDRLTKSAIDALEKELRKSTQTMYTAFNTNFKDFEIALLKKQKLISSFQVGSVKNKFVRNGTHLNYLIFQGVSVRSLSKVEDMLKKGLETVLPAEFNTPLYLENFITFGKTLNTEFMKTEVEAGLLLDQLKGLLITNGTEPEREILTIKIVSELIKTGVPCLIFDFNGNWSRLIKMFQKSKYEEMFLYFKLLHNFKIDILHSDIEFDRDNVKYLEYMLDSYSLSFQKDEKSMANMKKKIKKDSENTLSDAQFSLKVNNEESLFRNWPINEFLEIFDDLSEDDFNYFSLNQNHDVDVTVKDFVKDAKTVVLDLSTHRDYKKKMFFSAIILSKIIHYCNNSENFEPKIIVVPGIDLFFNAKFLERTANYKKIDEFLVPLLNNRFGFVCTANQGYFLPNLFYNYFQNIITYKTTDSRDIATFKNLIGLNEMKGAGYYTKSRYYTYQMEYLMNMKPNEVIVKRNDIPQPFPVIIECEEIIRTKTMSYEKIIKYMERQGYDLGTSQKRLMQMSEKSIFEIDLNSHFKYINEIMNFFTEIGKLKGFALYKSNLQQHLKEALYRKVRKQTTNNKKLEKIRNDVFELLVKKGFLVESSEKDAAGYQTMRTCYKIGDHYSEALRDYDEYRKRLETTIKVDTLQKQTDKDFKLDNTIPLETDQEQPKEDQDEYLTNETIKTDALEYAEKLKDLYHAIVLIYAHFEQKQHENAFKVIKTLIPLLDYFQKEKSCDISDLEKEISELNLSDVNRKEKMVNIYNLLAKFFNLVQNFNDLSSNENNNENNEEE